MNISFYNKSFHRCTWTYCSVKTQNRNVKARMQVEHGVLNYFFIFPQLIFFVAYVLILSRKSVSVSQMKKWYMNINNKQFVVLKGYLVLSDAVQNVSVFFAEKFSNSKCLLIANEILIATGYIIYFCIPILIICNKACVTRYSLMS